MTRKRKVKLWETLSQRERVFVGNVLKKVAHRSIEEKRSIVLDFCEVKMTDEQIEGGAE